MFQKTHTSATRTGAVHQKWRDIILDGFNKAEQTHGLFYIQFIGDGDSSVYPMLLHMGSRDNQNGKAAGTGQAGQAKTGPLFSALGLVMIVNRIDRMVKIVT